MVTNKTDLSITNNFLFKCFLVFKLILKVKTTIHSVKEDVGCRVEGFDGSGSHGLLEDPTQLDCGSLSQTTVVQYGHHCPQIY